MTHPPPVENDGLERHTLHALDGATVHAYVARPAGPPQGCVVVAQEIFGVTAAIRWVLRAQYAQAGYLAIAPCFLDRVAPGMVFESPQQDMERARAAIEPLGWDGPLRDIRAAQVQLAGGLPTAVVGFCWGGTLAFLAATRLGLPAISYYGARTPLYLHERPQAPLLLHFGAEDPLIPPASVRQISQALPDSACHVYPAGHAFNRHGDPAWHEASARRAESRSVAFLRHQLGNACV